MDLDLPISKIKRIAKFDPEINLVSQEAAIALTFATEFFIKTLAKHSCRQTQLNKRKTLQMKDMENALKLNSSFDFLDGVLETFSEQPTFFSNDDHDVASSEQANLPDTETPAPDINDVLITVNTETSECKKQRVEESIAEDEFCVVSIA